MSEESKKYRAEMKAKAHRLGSSGDPHERVDASSWTPPESMHTEAPTGPRPVSRRQYKRGGHVEGVEAQHHAGKRPRRKAGGKALVDDFVNRDVKDANEDREGIKHIGGMKTGGRTRKAGGGPLGGALGQSGVLGSFAYPAAKSALQNLGMKKGGEAKHEDKAEDEKLIHAEVKPSALKRKDGGRLYQEQFSNHAGGRDARAAGGGIPQLRSTGAQHEVSQYRGGGDWDRRTFDTRAQAEGHARSISPDPGGMFHNMNMGAKPRKTGGKLDAKERDHLPKRDFGEPGSRKYPMPDKSHAANAKARASQQEHAGRLSCGEEEKIDTKADRVLARKGGGRAGKGKMSVNIVIAPQGHPPGPPMGAAPPMPAPMPPPPRPPMPVAGPAGAPPGMAGAPPMMPPGGMPPVMPRKRGGRADLDAGAGSGLGRLEKVKDYGGRARELDGHY